MLDNLIKWFETIGTLRAAAELERLGYHKEAKRLMKRGRV
jgi:hypothetical protein